MQQNTPEATSEDVERLARMADFEASDDCQENIHARVS